MSPEFALPEPGLGPSPFDQRYPLLAKANSTVLLVWQQRNQQGDWEVLASRIDEDGEILEEEPTVILDNFSYLAELDLEGSGDAFMLAYKRSGEYNRVYGKRITLDGQPADGDPSLPGILMREQLEGDMTSFSFAGGDGQYLLVWSEFIMDDPMTWEQRVAFNRIDSAGNLLDGAPQDPGVDLVPVGGEQAGLPSAGWANGQYLVAWIDNVSEDGRYNHLRLTRLRPDGTLVDAAPLDVATAEVRHSQPRIYEFNGKPLITWYEGFGSSPLRANGIEADGTLTIGLPEEDGVIWLQEQTMGNGQHLFSSIGTTGLLIWSSWEDFNNVQIRAKKIHSLTDLESATVVVDSVNRQNLSGIVPLSSTFHVFAWTDYRFGQNKAYYGLVSKRGGGVGNPASLGTPLGGLPLEQTNIRLAFDGTRYLVVWEEERIPGGVILGTTVPAGGGPSSSDPNVLVGSELGQSKPDIIFNGSEFVMVWKGFYDRWGNGNFSEMVMMSRLNPAATYLIDGDPAQPGLPLTSMGQAAGPAIPLDPKIVKGKSRYLVAANAKGGAFLDFDLQNPEPVVFYNSYFDGDWLRAEYDLEANQDYYLIAWSESKTVNGTSTRRLSHRRELDPLGTAEWGGHGFLTPHDGNSNHSGTPRMVWTGDHWFVTWTGGTNIRGAWVQNNGNIPTAFGTYYPDFRHQVLDHTNAAAGSPVSLHDGLHSWAMWLDSRSGMQELYGGRIDDTGAPSIDPADFRFFISHTPISAFDAVSSGSGQIGMVYQRTLENDPAAKGLFFRVAAQCQESGHLEIIASNPGDTCPGEPVTLEALVYAQAEVESFQWTRNGEDIPGATEAIFVADEMGQVSYNCRVKLVGCDYPFAAPNNVLVKRRSAPYFDGVVSVEAEGQCEYNAATVRWDEATSVCGAVTYNVYRSHTAPFDPGPDTLIASGISGTSWLDSAIDPTLNRYYYMVRSVDVTTGVEDENEIYQWFDLVNAPGFDWLDDGGDTRPVSMVANEGWTRTSDEGYLGSGGYKTGEYPADSCLTLETPYMYVRQAFWDDPEQPLFTFDAKHDINPLNDLGVLQYGRLSADGHPSWYTYHAVGPDYLTASTTVCGKNYFGHAFSANHPDPVYNSYQQILNSSIPRYTWVKFRFTLSSDEIDSAQGWWVDNIQVKNAQVVAPNPVSTCEGGNAEFRVDFTPGQGYQVQWYKDGLPLVDSGRITGSTGAVLSISGVAADDQGMYVARLEDACGLVVTTPEAALTLDGTPPQVDGFANGKRFLRNMTTMDNDSITLQGSGFSNSGWGLAEVTLMDTETGDLYPLQVEDVAGGIKVGFAEPLGPAVHFLGKLVVSNGSCTTDVDVNGEPLYVAVGGGPANQLFALQNVGPASGGTHLKLLPTGPVFPDEVGVRFETAYGAVAFEAKAHRLENGMFELVTRPMLSGQYYKLVMEVNELQEFISPVNGGFKATTLALVADQGHVRVVDVDGTIGQPDAPRLSFVDLDRATPGLQADYVLDTSEKSLGINVAVGTWHSSLLGQPVAYGFVAYSSYVDRIDLATFERPGDFAARLQQGHFLDAAEYVSSGSRAFVADIAFGLDSDLTTLEDQLIFIEVLSSTNPFCCWQSPIPCFGQVRSITVSAANPISPTYELESGISVAGEIMLCRGLGGNTLVRPKLYPGEILRSGPYLASSHVRQNRDGNWRTTVSVHDVGNVQEDCEDCTPYYPLLNRVTSNSINLTGPGSPVSLAAIRDVGRLGYLDTGGLSLQQFMVDPALPEFSPDPHLATSLVPQTLPLDMEWMLVDSGAGEQSRLYLAEYNDEQGQPSGLIRILDVRPDEAAQSVATLSIPDQALRPRATTGRWHGEVVSGLAGMPYAADGQAWLLVLDAEQNALHAFHASQHTLLESLPMDSMQLLGEVDIAALPRRDSLTSGGFAAYIVGEMDPGLFYTPQQQEVLSSGIDQVNDWMAGDLQSSDTIIKRTEALIHQAEGSIQDEEAEATVVSYLKAIIQDLSQ